MAGNAGAIESEAGCLDAKAVEQSTLSAASHVPPVIMHAESDARDIAETLPLSISSSFAASTQYWTEFTGLPDLTSVLGGSLLQVVATAQSITVSGSFDEFASQLHRRQALSEDTVLTKFFNQFIARRKSLEADPRGFDLRYSYLACERNIGLLFLIRLSKTPTSMFHVAWSSITKTPSSSHANWCLEYILVGGPQPESPQEMHAAIKSVTTRSDNVDETAGIQSRFPLHRGSLSTLCCRSRRCTEIGS